MTADPVEIVPVTSRARHHAFCALPYDLYRGDPRWVPPLRTVERRRWSGRRNASLRERRVRRFLASRHGRAVGRVASIVDPAFAERWDPEAGFFGFFECTDDPPAARALLAAAEDDLGAQGCRRVLGPVNLTTHDEVGLLVDGFDSPPMILSPYNPPCYPALVAAAGYEPRLDYHSYAWTPDTPLSPVVQRIERRAARQGIVVRPADPRAWGAENRLLHRLYNASFDDTWGFVPLSWEEYRGRAKDFRPFYRPELVWFAEVNGQAVGFGLSLPNVNELLASLDGRLWPFGWLRLARGFRRIHSARFILLGVLPDYRARGVAVVLAARMAEAARRLGLQRGELSLVQAESRKVQTIIAACGGPRLKTYRLYQKRFPG